MRERPLLAARGRRSIDVDTLVVHETLAPGQGLPLALHPTRPEVDLVSWAQTTRGWLRERLHEHGALLFRGFSGVSQETFERFVAAVSGDALPYVERSSPRTAVGGGNVYTSTEQPPDQTIFLHNEHSYSLSWPMRLFFYCATAPAEGGATPLADTRKIYARLSERTREIFDARRYAYVRRNRPGMGLDWTEVYQTDDRAVVETYCRDNDIAFDWQADGSLTTSQVRPLVRTHPATQEPVWFNHMLFFNVSTLDDATRSALSAADKTDLPNNTYYADGEEIEPEILAEVRAAYEAEQVRFAWQEGDILMIDNMLVSHAREAFTPPRRILVAMTEPAESFEG